MCRGVVLLLPLLLVSETLAAATHRMTTLERLKEHIRHPISNEDDLQPTGDMDSLTSPLTRWWNNVDSLFSRHPPLESSLTEPGFFNDLRLAFTLSTDPVTTQHGLKNQGLSPRAQQVLKTMCRLKSTIYDDGWDDGDVPNYVPTDSDGQPLPTQTIGDGHGGGGSEIIAVTSMCGNIGPGATGEHSQPLSSLPPTFVSFLKLMEAAFRF